MKTTLETKYQYAVYVNYAYADKQCGDVISRHKTYDAAAKKIRSHGYKDFLGIRDIKTSAKTID